MNFHLFQYRRPRHTSLSKQDQISEKRTIFSEKSGEGSDDVNDEDDEDYDDEHDYDEVYLSFANIKQMPVKNEQEVNVLHIFC